jgi:hypothetical protein
VTNFLAGKPKLIEVLCTHLQRYEESATKAREAYNAKYKTEKEV